MFSQLLAAQHFFSKWGREQGTHGPHFPSCSAFARSQPTIRTSIFFESFCNTCAQLCQKRLSKYKWADQRASIFETNQPFLSYRTLLSFHRDQRDALCLDLCHRGKAAESTVGKPSACVSIHSFTHFNRGRQGNSPLLWARWLFCHVKLFLGQ